MLEALALTCPKCNGRKWINHGLIAATVDEVQPDIAIVDWRPCKTCNGEGVYVSRERAGLSL